MKKRPPYLHIALFVLTFLTTLLAGAMQQGINPLEEPGRIHEGLPFSLALMTILLSHELGHFFTSRAHHVSATLPYFIPAPSFIGTFGAFIKMKSPIRTRRALIDIGASGPMVGLVLSVIASAAGLAYSEFIVVSGEGARLGLGNSLLFSFMADLVLGTPPEGYDILLHPIAFAGWIGLFVTSLNLIPIGQLDGGHVAFALLGGRHRTLSMLLVIVLAGAGIIFWEGWLIWALLMVILGVEHPPIVYWESPLDPRRKLVGWATVAIFVLTFTPRPFTVV